MPTIEEQFHEIQQTVEQARVRCLMLEKDITTDGAIPMNRKTYRDWDMMMREHRILANIYEQACAKMEKLFPLSIPE